MPEIAETEPFVKLDVVDLAAQQLATALDAFRGTPESDTRQTLVSSAATAMELADTPNVGTTSDESRAALDRALDTLPDVIWEAGRARYEFRLEERRRQASLADQMAWTDIGLVALAAR